MTMVERNSFSMATYTETSDIDERLFLNDYISNGGTAHTGGNISRQNIILNGNNNVKQSASSSSSSPSRAYNNLSEEPSILEPKIKIHTSNNRRGNINYNNEVSNIPNILVTDYDNDNNCVCEVIKSNEYLLLYHNNSADDSSKTHCLHPCPMSLSNYQKSLSERYRKTLLSVIINKS